MKKKALTLSLTVVLAFAVANGMRFVNTATANPAPLFPLPWDGPVTTPPTITVCSPTQGTIYNSTQIWINFTIALSNETRFENVTCVYYQVDGGKRQNITVHDIDTLFYPSARTLNFSTYLTFKQGFHNITVSLDADSYFVAYSASEGFTVPSTVVHNDSETINFTVVDPVFTESLIAVIVISILLLASIGFVYVHKKVEASHYD